MAEFMMNNNFFKRFFCVLFGFFSCYAVATELSVSYPHRIVALSPHTVELLFSIGAGDRIVGVTNAADYPAQVSGITKVGGHHGLQLETIVELEPDLILAWEGGNKGADVNRLEELGFQIYRGNTKKLDGIAFEVRELGRLTGLTINAEIVARNFERDLQKLRETYQSKPPVSFFYQLWAKPLRSISPASWINEMMVGCGGRNIVADISIPYPEISMESVLIAAPEIIIQPADHGSDIPSMDVWQKWQEIPAVANNRIYKIDGDLVHRFSLRVIEGMQQVCEQFEQVRKSQ